MDIIIKAAAVADYRPENVSEEKIKKQDGNMAIPLTRTKDILAYLGEHKKDGQFICGFTDNYIKVKLPYDAGLANRIIPIRLEKGLFCEDE